MLFQSIGFLSRVLALILSCQLAIAFSANRLHSRIGGIGSMLSKSALGASSEDEISLGAPRNRPNSGSYMSPAGIVVDRVVQPLQDVVGEIRKLVHSLDDNMGAILTSSYEFPGRYARWTVGFTSPPIQIEGRRLDFSITALNQRGEVLLEFIRDHLAASPTLFQINSVSPFVLKGKVIPSTEYFAEEERSKQPTLFSLVRAIRDLFFSSEPEQLGLFGSFGYDLTFQFGKFYETLC